MHLILADWLIVALYFVISAAIGLAYTRKAGTSLDEYFVSGRSLPWWLAGTSMVATTFAADTPLAVAGFVAKYGVAGNWLWWNGAFSGVLTVFFFSRLWRRAGVMTDVEFAELRYGGKPAAALRGFRALYLALPINLIIMGWVTRAMVKILQVTLDVNPWRAAIVLFGVTALYSVFSGLWGVIVTDAFQFVVAMGGTILLAVVAVDSVGGLDALTAKPRRTSAPPTPRSACCLPLDKAWLPLSTLLIFLGVQWWAAWYPGQEPGGGGYVVQRILSAKDERDGLLATLWFTIAHYALRPWPWILVGFVGLIRYPGLANPEEGYVRVMVDVLPSPWKGLLLAAFAAAYMSTISTHLNWGASYLVNDFYLRFIRPEASPRAQVFASRLATVVLMVCSLIVMSFLSSVEQGWKLLIGLGAGTGLVFILRWYWWRVNAWSEISAMIASFVTSVLLAHYDYTLNDLSTPGVREDHADHRRGDHRGLAGGHLRHPSGDRRDARPVLPARASGRAGMAARLGQTGLSGGQDPRRGPLLGQLGGRAGGGLLRCRFPGGPADRHPYPGVLYGAVAIAAFSLIQRNLRNDKTLEGTLTAPSPAR